MNVVSTFMWVLVVFLLKSNESSEYSYVGLGVFFWFFFSGNSLKICSRSILIFRGLSSDFFSSSVHFDF